MNFCGGWLVMVFAALLVGGCGVGGSESLRPVGAVTVATLPEEMREQQQLLQKPQPRPRRRRGGPGSFEDRAAAAVAPEVDAWAEPLPEAVPDEVPEAEKLYRRSCQACHSLDLVEHHRLDREQWERVLEDMAEVYGVTWITPKQRGQLLEYLTENLGPDTKTR